MDLGTKRCHSGKPTSPTSLLGRFVRRLARRTGREYRASMDEPTPSSPAPATSAPAGGRGRVALAAVLPFIPFGIGWALKYPLEGSGAIDLVVVGGLLAIPTLAGAMIRLVRSWGSWRWAVGAAAIAVGALGALLWVDIAREDCLTVSEPIAAAIPGLLTAGWVVVVAGATAWVARPAGSVGRAVAAFVAGGVLTVPVLLAALFVLGLTYAFTSVPNCELIHIL